jgi:hypothetical protein
MLSATHVRLQRLCPQNNQTPARLEEFYCAAVKIATVGAVGSTWTRLVPGMRMQQRKVGLVLRIQEVEANIKLGVSVRGVFIPPGNSVGVLVLLVTSSFSALGVEQTEAVRDYRLLGLSLGSHRRRHEGRSSTLRQCNVAFVVEEPDLAAPVLRPRHHAGTGKCGVADRVGVKVGVRSVELDINDDKVRDVLHVITKALLCQALGSSIADQNVAGDPTSHLVIDMAVNAELMLSPANFDLERYQ